MASIGMVALMGAKLAIVWVRPPTPIKHAISCKKSLSSNIKIINNPGNRMNIKFRLVLMNFLEFFVWGAWLISLGAYMFNVLHFSGVQVGSIYGTMGLASLLTPALFGIVADRWLNAERVLGICHVLGALC